MAQNYVSQNFQLFKIPKSPFIFSPFDKGGNRGILNMGILICFILSAEKIYRKTYESKRKY
jgi:hypothetical protein